MWVTGGNDFSIRVYDPATFIEKKALLGHVKSITQIHRRDERSLVTSGADGYIRVWELKSGRQIGTLSGHHFHIVGFFLDGRYAVSGSLDGSLRVWDVPTSRTLSVVNVGSSSEPMFALTRVSKTRFIGAFPSGIMKMWDLSSVLAAEHREHCPSLRPCVGPGVQPSMYFTASRDFHCDKGGFAFSPSKRPKDPATVTLHPPLYFTSCHSDPQVEKAGMVGARESLSRNAPSRIAPNSPNLPGTNRKVRGISGTSRMSRTSELPAGRQNSGRRCSTANMQQCQVPQTRGPSVSV
jgi:WD40 repeat protein